MKYVLKQEINDFYKQLYNKDFPSSTLSKWKKEKRIDAIPSEENSREFLYNYEQFKDIVTSDDYKKKIKASKEKPEDYIGKKTGFLQVLGIVPENERKEKDYKGTLMYCHCLRCNRPDKIQVRFSYLTNGGNYNQETCGCGRKERAFLASSREGISKEFLAKYQNNFEYFLYLHKLLTSCTDKYYIHCPIEEYEKAIIYLDENEQFHKVYDFWNKQEKNNTFYDWAKPSLDHIVPKSKGGTNKIENLQVVTVFENLAKRDMTWDEWCDFKRKTNSTSDYYIENIMSC